MSVVSRETLRMPDPLPHPTRRYQLAIEDDGSDPALKYLLFTSDVLQEVRHDIIEAVVPTWVEKPPSNFGEARHGKLKADQWRTVCTIFMAMTLVRLWGHSRAKEEERVVLENFVQLIVAADLATRRSMSPERAAKYDDNIQAYVRGLRSIYNHHLVPNHHLALHLKDFLLLFGPVHGWWTYPYERLNGLLQRMNTNHKSGKYSFVALFLLEFTDSVLAAEMPLTYMRYFYISANLRYHMSTVSWPNIPVFHEWLKSFNDVFRDLTSGTRFIEVFTNPSAPEVYAYNERQESLLPQSTYEYVLAHISSTTTAPLFASAYAPNRSRLPRLPQEGYFVRSIMRKGVKFTTASSGERD